MIIRRLVTLCSDYATADHCLCPFLHQWPPCVCGLYTSLTTICVCINISDRRVMCPIYISDRYFCLFIHRWPLFVSLYTSVTAICVSFYVGDRHVVCPVCISDRFVVCPVYISDLYLCLLLHQWPLCCVSYNTSVITIVWLFYVTLTCMLCVLCAAMTPICAHFYITNHYVMCPMPCSNDPYLCSFLHY